MKEQINLSDSTRKKLGIGKDEEITHELLSKKCYEFQSLAKYNMNKPEFHMSLSDGKVLEKYMDLREVNTKIDRERNRQEEELLLAAEYIYGSPDKIISLRENEGLKNKPVVFEMFQSDMDKYLDFEIEEMKNETKIQGTWIDVENLTTFDFNRASIFPNKDVYYKDCDFPEKSFDTLFLESKKIEELTEGLMDKPEREKYTEICKRIVNNISYDLKGPSLSARHFKKDNKKRMKNPNYRADMHHKTTLNQNLYGLIKQSTVCAGFARTLEASLERVNMEAKVMIGFSGVGDEVTPDHAWNQVKIDGVWYNTDLTYDAVNIRNGFIPQYSLKSDIAFPGHMVLPRYPAEKPIGFRKEVPKEECPKSYDQREVARMFAGEDKLPSKKYMQIIDHLKTQGEIVDVDIFYDPNQYSYKCIFSNEAKDGLREEFDDYQLRCREMVDLVQGFSEEHEIEASNYEDELYVHSTDNVNIRADASSTNTLRTICNNESIDIDDMLKPQKEKNVLQEEKKIKGKDMLKSAIDETKVRVSADGIEKQTDEMIATKRERKNIEKEDFSR